MYVRRKQVTEQENKILVRKFHVKLTRPWQDNIKMHLNSGLNRNVTT